MGVKSLWSLLTPVGRPVLLETTEGKVMAIDSSIWIYQFQATMRDKDGRALVNAHVLGFLRRISKLLFYGIKPVFVFDGGAPTLKKNTLRGRREKKSGAAASHAKLAEKLLAAQMRREALGNAATSGHRSTPKGKETSTQIQDDRTVYLEDIESTMAKTPTRKKIVSPPSSSKKARFYDHDPYKLPEIDLEAAVARATHTVAPDPRLATEEELRAFIEEMRPEDFDVTSPAFRELPTEVQYEIVGDLRLKSRQTSHARLQKMLRNAPTPLDFSKQQIKNLRQRNTLTQQLLTTTDSIGSAHISIPVRIASERNKEYVLMKNEGESGGWILGIRNEGTKEKPIEIDQEKDVMSGGDSDEDMEEVSIPTPAPDPDLRKSQLSMALPDIENRVNQTQRAPVPLPAINRRLQSKPLFDLDDDTDVAPRHEPGLSDDDDLLAIAIQASFEREHYTKPQDESNKSPSPNVSPLGASALSAVRNLRTKDSLASEPPSRLETALSIANTGPARPMPQSSPSVFGQPILLASPSCIQAISANATRSTLKTYVPSPMHFIENTYNHAASATAKPSANDERYVVDLDPEADKATAPVQPEEKGKADQPRLLQASSEFISEEPVPAQGGVETIEVVSEDDMEEVILEYIPNSEKATGHDEYVILAETSLESAHPPGPENGFLSSPSFEPSPRIPPEDQEDEDPIPWSRSVSPSNRSPADLRSRPLSPPHANFDAAKEMNLPAEEGEYARFISQVKGKDIEDVRREIDDEIKYLNQQKKVAMRDSEDITQQMIAQIMTMLRLFGIPYITAPMEAEAQCAELVSLGLVDGVITDDSDVFLFGAKRVFKNMFNQSKTVECFLLTDLSRELGLERETLIRLAYLLGSDYVDGLPGVGPVVAMELLEEFPGEEGLVSFKDWWLKVQTGKDREEDSKSSFRKQFKNKFKDLYISDDWPNPAVKDAYLHPTVDSSNEPFKWGLPDLDALRMFLKTELGWGQAKVDDILLPLIQKMNKRGQAAALNKQGNLGEFFDMPSGSGTLAPRKRKAYTSKRLQNVVDELRRKRGQVASSSSSEGEDRGKTTETEKRLKTTSKGKRKEKTSTGPRNSTSRRKVVKGKERRARKTSHNNNDETQESDTGMRIIPSDPVVVARLRPRPRIRTLESSSTQNDADTNDQEDNHVDY